MGTTLFTIGHSTHSLEYFLSLLAKHRIEAICDVRSIPYSQHNPQFNREQLKERLRAVGVAYVFLGKELGARSGNSDSYIHGKVQYNHLAQEPSFQEGLKRVRTGIETLRIALMCAERDPLACHRTILVCRKLRSVGLQIEHILGDGTIETNTEAEKRLMSIVNILPDMFHSEQDCIEQAYDRQADSIAYVIDRPHEDIHNRVHE
jgi:uncharacterized protein (DUF488 family)